MQTLSVGARVTGVSAILCACQPSFPPTTTRRDLPAAAARICACGYSLPPGQHRLANRRRERIPARSEEHTSELQSLMRISYAVFCLKKKNIKKNKVEY